MISHGIVGEIGNEFELEFDGWTRTPGRKSVLSPACFRFDAADGVWRVAFAFDTKRKATLLVAGDKSGVSEKKFYKRLIAKADERFDVDLARLQQKERK